MKDDGSPGTIRVQEPWTGGPRASYGLCFAMLPLALLLLPFAAIAHVLHADYQGCTVGLLRLLGALIERLCRQTPG